MFNKEVKRPPTGPTLTIGELSWLLSSRMDSFTRWSRSNRNPEVDKNGRIIYYAKEVGDWIEKISAESLKLGLSAAKETPAIASDERNISSVSTV